MKCEKCQQELKIGDWPFCPHGSLRSRAAEYGQPTIVYKNQKGDCYFPTGSNSKPPAGYEKHELRTQHERDKFERTINEKETVKLRERIYRDRAEWEQTFASHKEGLNKAREELLRAGHKPEIIEQCLRNYEKRDKDYDRKLRDEAGFHIESNHYLSGYKHDE